MKEFGGSLPTLVVAAIGGVVECAHADDLFRRYAKAKRMVGADPGTVRYEKLVQTISGQLPQLRQMNQGREVEFDVVIRQGKVVLKAKPT